MLIVGMVELLAFWITAVVCLFMTSPLVHCLMVARTFILALGCRALHASPLDWGREVPFIR